MIGIIGDTHFKESLGYSDYVKDGRKQEKEDILSFIVESFKDCDQIVFLGDQLNSKNNMSEVIRDFISFVERFGDKEVYIISGNHEKKGDGTTAIDFMKEITRSNWHIITQPLNTYMDGKAVTFLPYMNKAELVAMDDAEATAKIMSILLPGDLLFLHHAISDSDTVSGQNTNMFHEAVLPRNELENRYKLVIGGHIHSPQYKGKTIVTGSIFNNEAGETEKYIWKISKGLSAEKIKLPGRPIHNITNPSPDLIDQLEDRSIVKVTLTDKGIDVSYIEEKLKRFDAYLLLEQYPNQRKKLHFDSGAIDFSIENLLKMYAEEKGVDLGKLMTGFELIKQ